MTTSETLRTMAAIIDRLDLTPISATTHSGLHLKVAEFRAAFAGRDVAITSHSPTYDQLAVTEDGIELFCLIDRAIPAPTSMVL